MKEAKKEPEVSGLSSLDSLLSSAQARVNSNTIFKQPYIRLHSLKSFKLNQKDIE